MTEGKEKESNQTYDGEYTETHMKDEEGKGDGQDGRGKKLVTGKCLEKRGKRRDGEGKEGKGKDDTPPAHLVQSPPPPSCLLSPFNATLVGGAAGDTRD